MSDQGRKALKDALTLENAYDFEGAKNVYTLEKAIEYF